MSLSLRTGLVLSLLALGNVLGQSTQEALVNAEDSVPQVCLGESRDGSTECLDQQLMADMVPAAAVADEAAAAAQEEDAVQEETISEQAGSTIHQEKEASTASEDDAEVGDYDEEYYGYEDASEYEYEYDEYEYEDETEVVMCQDFNPSCKYWSDLGECETNPAYMLWHCRMSCQVCEEDLTDFYKQYYGDMEQGGSFNFRDAMHHHDDLMQQQQQQQQQQPQDEEAMRRHHYMMQQEQQRAQEEHHRHMHHTEQYMQEMNHYIAQQRAAGTFDPNDERVKHFEHHMEEHRRYMAEYEQFMAHSQRHGAFNDPDHRRMHHSQQQQQQQPQDEETMRHHHHMMQQQQRAQEEHHRYMHHTEQYMQEMNHYIEQQRAAGTFDPNDERVKHFEHRMEEHRRYMAEYEQFMAHSQRHGAFNYPDYAALVKSDQPREYPYLAQNAWGEPQGLLDAETELKLAETQEYMFRTVFVDPEYVNVRATCRNMHEHCTFWAKEGECEKNPQFMERNCAPACENCYYLDYAHRCPVDLEAAQATNAWKPGDLAKFFKNLTTNEEFVEKFKPTILSKDPWIVQLEDFTTAEECERLIELGAKTGYTRSADYGPPNPDGTFAPLENDRRTSTNAWCYSECMDDPLAKSVLNRITEVTGIPDTNSEFLQLLRYEVTQKYQSHHDYVIHEPTRPQGVRMLTVFLYLNDVEAGGGTHFSFLNLTVTPKQGRAVVWPSVMDQHPDHVDYRTEHEALPVEAGIKYGANAWLHQRDFKTPHAHGCI